MNKPKHPYYPPRWLDKLLERFCAPYLLEEVIWNNMVFIQWQQGDVIAIDNFSTSHTGEMPGARSLYNNPARLFMYTQKKFLHLLNKSKNNY